MKHLYIIFLISFLHLVSFAQNEYYLAEGAKVVGIKLFDSSELMNSQFCQVKKVNKIIQYTPFEVEEFGFDDGRVYVSKEIHIADSSKRVFLERLQKGNTTLYYYRGKGIKTFFIQKDSTLLIEIPKKDKERNDYSRQLLNLTKDCPNILDACKLVSYNKKSLSRLISRYNQCVLKPFPHFKYGIINGYEFKRLIPYNKGKNSYIDYFDFNYKGGYLIGLFIDNPISVSQFSLHIEATCSEFGQSYNKRINNEDIDFVFNCTSLKVPILIRYLYPSNIFRPFINIGLAGVYNLKNESMLLETKTQNNKITINETDEKLLIDKAQLGYCFGGGIEYKINFKNSIFIEFRYDKIYSISDKNLLNISGIKCVTGINF